MTSKIYKHLLFLFVGLSLSIASIAQADSSDRKKNIFDYFYDQEGTPLIRIDTDTKTLYRRKSKEEYQPGIISFNDPEGVMLDIPMKLRTRGNMRKQQCNYPPLKVNFQKEDLKALGLSKKLDKLKFVLQCAGNSSSKDYLMKERLIYDLYDIVDPENGFRTKLVKVEMWKDGELDKELEGFIIEDEDQYASRRNARIIESGNVRTASLKRSHYLKMVFFQYMISNTDWSIANKHNVEMVGLPGSPRIVAVPYDFDYAGFVGTTYAVPHESLPIEKVTDRHFQGYLVTEGEAKATCDFFNKKKEEFYAACDNASYCSEKVRKNAKRHLEGFFDLTDSDRRIKSIFVTDVR